MKAGAVFAVGLGIVAAAGAVALGVWAFVAKKGPERLAPVDTPRAYAVGAPAPMKVVESPPATRAQASQWATDASSVLAGITGLANAFGGIAKTLDVGF